MPLKITDAHFEILGVTRRSTKEEIKKSYRMAMKKWHPDKFANNPELLQRAQEISKKLNEAYSVLKNYDPLIQSQVSNFKIPTAKNEFYRIAVTHYKIFSLNIISAGYDAKLRILQVQYRNGFIYQYYNISASFFKTFMVANSKGKFIRKKIEIKSVGKRV